LATDVPLYKVVWQSIELAYHFLRRILFMQFTLFYIQQTVEKYNYNFLHFSERELKFTLAICCRPSVCRLSACRLSVVCLYVTFVHPTQPVEILVNVSTPFGTLAIH